MRASSSAIWLGSTATASTRPSTCATWSRWRSGSSGAGGRGVRPLRVVAGERLDLQPFARDADLDGAEAAVGGGVGRLVGEEVLGAQVGKDRLVDRRELGDGLEEDAAAAGLLRELA